MNSKLLALAAVLIIATATVGAGYAYTGSTDSVNNSLEVDHISAVNSNGGSYIQVPTVAFTKTGSTYVPDDEAATTSGTLTLTSASDTPRIRAWVEYYNALSWTAIKALTVTVDGTEYQCFNSSASAGSLSTCLPTEAIELTPGDHTFSIDVVFKTAIDVNPSAYTGSNMKSRVVFLMDTDDPLSA